MSKKKKSPPKVSPLATIKFRVDEFLAHASTANGEAVFIREQLDALAQGVKPEQMFSFLLFALQTAPPNVVENVSAVAPEWIRARGFGDNLKQFLLKESLSGQTNSVGSRWLQDLNIDISTDIQARKKAEEDLFVEAWAHDEEEWQSSVYALWHTDKREHQQHGFCMLIDRNPEWDGAIKDFFFIKPHNVQRFKEHARQLKNGYGGVQYKPRSASELKRILYNALQDSKRMGLRPPREIVEALEEFWKFWTLLPDTPLTADFSREDFERICFSGTPSEALRLREQTVRRIASLEDDEFFPSNLPSLKDIEQLLDLEREMDEQRREELEAMTTDELWARLCEAGLAQSEKELLESAKETFSLEGFAMDCADMSKSQTGDDENDIILGVPIWLRRFLPVDLFAESLEDRLDDAFEEIVDLYEEEDNADKEVEAYFKVWAIMKNFIAHRNAAADFKPLRSVDDMEETLQSFTIPRSIDFFSDCRYIATDIAKDFSALIPKTRAFLQDMLDALPESEEQPSKLDILLGLANLSSGEGDFAGADALHERILKEYPSNADVYINWSELYAAPFGAAGQTNIAKAREILLRGLEEPEIDADYLQDYLDELEG